MGGSDGSFVATFSSSPESATFAGKALSRLICEAGDGLDLVDFQKRAVNKLTEYVPQEFLIGSDYVLVEFGVCTTPVVSSSCKPNVVTVNLVRVAYARGKRELTLLRQCFHQLRGMAHP